MSSCFSLTGEGKTSNDDGPTTSGDSPLTISANIDNFAAHCTTDSTDTDAEEAVAGGRAKRLVLGRESLQGEVGGEKFVEEESGEGENSAVSGEGDEKNGSGETGGKGEPDSIDGGRSCLERKNMNLNVGTERRGMEGGRRKRNFLHPSEGGEEQEAEAGEVRRKGRQKFPRPPRPNKQVPQH